MSSYIHDDCGVKCRLNPEDETDIQPVEPHCLNCGSPTAECDCGDYEEGKYFKEEKKKCDFSKVQVIDCGSGKVLTGDDAVPMFLREGGEELVDRRGKELETFLKCLESFPLNKVILREKSVIYHTGGEGFSSWWDSARDPLMDFLMDKKNHKVDGKKWNNGILGSRWADVELVGRKCRISFYSKKSDPQNFEKMPQRVRGNGKDYILSVNPLYFG